MKEGENMNIQTKKKYSWLRYLVPLIAIFFGFLYWLDGFNYFINDLKIWIYVTGYSFLGFWFFTLCYLFIGLIRINFLSKIFVLLIALSVSFNFYVMLMYNNSQETILRYILSPKDMLIIKVASYMSILGVVPIIIADIAPKFHAELNFLTNITHIKDRESKTRHKFLEIWASFPVFIGINSIFFLIFVINDTYRWNEMPFNYVLILVLPWLFLILFHIIYATIVSFKEVIKIKNIWILPFLGGLLSLIILIIPATSSYFSNEGYEFARNFWMWGFFYARYYFFEYFKNETFLGFTIFSPEIFIPGLIATIFILVSANSCIKTALRFRKGERHFSEIKKSWLITGILYIIAPIIYVVGMQIGFSLFQQRIGGSPLNFWQENVPTFAIIAPFISGLLVLVGVILGTAIMGKDDTLYKNKIPDFVSKS